MAPMHEVDYEIFGDDMQFVEVELDPQEAALAEAGAMMFMDDGIEMETIFGDGTEQQGADGVLRELAVAPSPVDGERGAPVSASTRLAEAGAHLPRIDGVSSMRADPSRGAVLYDNSCSGCHDDDGPGRGEYRTRRSSASWANTSFATPVSSANRVRYSSLVMELDAARTVGMSRSSALRRCSMPSNHPLR